MIKCNLPNKKYLLSRLTVSAMLQQTQYEDEVSHDTSGSKMTMPLQEHNYGSATIISGNWLQFIHRIVQNCECLCAI